MYTPQTATTDRSLDARHCAAALATLKRLGVPLNMPLYYDPTERGTNLIVVDRASGVSTLLRMLPVYRRYLAR